MAATVAEHRIGGRHPRVDRTIHVGLLVCLGTHAQAPRGTRALTETKLGLAAGILRHEVRDVWRSFTRSVHGVEYRYRFAFEIVRSETPVAVQAFHPEDDVSDIAEREGLFRDARSALEEAAHHGLENIAIVVPRLPGRPHGSFVSEAMGVRPSEARDEERLRRLNAAGGLLPRASNAVAYEYERDLRSGDLSGAHEVGHLLGLTNTSNTGDIMGPNNSHDQASGRRLTSEDQRLLHAALEGRLPGLRRPAAFQTTGRQTPHRFDGFTSRDDE